MASQQLPEDRTAEIDVDAGSFFKEDGKSYAEDVDGLKEKTLELEEEIKRLSSQVLQLSAEKDAYEKHSKMLGVTLKKVRKSAAERHMKNEDLGVDLEENLEILDEDLSSALTAATLEEHPHFAALQLAAKENGWLIDPSQVNLGSKKKLGEGATANIYLADWHGLEVAVKCIRKSYLLSNKNGLESFMQEVGLLIRQRHPHILRLYGACLVYPTNCWLVSEVLPNGTLTEWLHGDKGRQWNRKIPLPPLKERLRMALEISLAMQYLHEQSPRVIHRDLKPSNIFIDASLHARVADFGFARVLKPHEEVLTGETGTYMYMAPEVIKHDHYDEKCDVYSFAVMLNELLVGHPPFIETYLTPVQMAVGVADGSMRPKLPTGVDSSLISLITTSWAQDQAKRPSFREISTLLKSHLQSVLKKEKEGTAADSVVVKDHKGGLFSFMH